MERSAPGNLWKGWGIKVQIMRCCAAKYRWSTKHRSAVWWMTCACVLICECLCLSLPLKASFPPSHLQRQICNCWGKKSAKNLFMKEMTDDFKPCVFLSYVPRIRCAPCACPCLVHTFVLAQPGHKTTSPQGPPEAGAEVEEGERLLCTLPCGWELKQGCPVLKWGHWRAPNDRPSWA